MCSAIETIESPVAVDQSHNISDTVAFPSGVVDEFGEDKLSGLVRFGFARNGKDDNQEGDYRGPQRKDGHAREGGTGEVEEGASAVDNLIADKGHPGLDLPIEMGTLIITLIWRQGGEWSTYKPGCAIRMQPTIRFPTPSAMLAHVKREPAQAIQPVRYERKRVYRLLAS